MFLYALSEGDRARVRSIAHHVQNLTQFGMDRGTEFSVVFRGKNGVVIRTAGIRIGLSREVATEVEVYDVLRAVR